MTIKRSLIASVVLACLGFAAVLVFHFATITTAVTDGSERYLSSIGLRVRDRISMLLDAEMRSMENIGHVWDLKNNKAYYLKNSNNQISLDKKIEVLTRYQSGKSHLSLRYVSSEGSTIILFRNGFLGDERNDHLPSSLMRGIVSGTKQSNFAVLPNADNPDSFYIVCALQDFDNNSWNYLIAEQPFSLYRKYVDAVLYNEDPEGLLSLAAGIYFNGNLAWNYTTSTLPPAAPPDTKPTSLAMFQGNTYVTSSAGLPHSDYKVVVFADRYALISPLLKYLFYGSTLFAVASGLFAIGIYALNRKISRPLIKLISATHAIASQNYQIDLPPATQDEIGKLTNSFKVMSDQIRRYQEEVRCSAAMAAIGQLSAQIAHDIRSPLSVLRSYVTMSREQSLSPADIEEYGPAADRSVSKLLNMAEDLLDYSKAQMVVKSSCRPDDLVHEVLIEVAPEASQRNVSVSYESVGDVRLNIDRAKLNRVLTNIIINGIQAHTGSGYVMVRCEIDGKDATLSVSDTGCGIPPDKFDIIFDRSFTFGKPKGTGLGLAYCKEVVGAHGGTIELESEVGKGSTFKIRLPDCVELAMEQPAGVVDTTTWPPTTRPQRILIADDEADIRAQWKKIVDERGGTVIYSASSAEEIRNHTNLDYAAIDTAIVDYEYEGFTLTGVDLIRFLKSKGVKNIHLCTGYAGDQEIRRQAEEAGASSVVSKPIDESEIQKIFPDHPVSDTPLCG